MEFSRTIGRSLALIMLGGVLFIVAPANRDTTAPFPATSPTVSPTSIPTPEAREKKPNPVRRFFSWVGGLVTRPFKRRVPVISDPPNVVVTPSKSLITSCPVYLQMTPEHRCSPEREVELSATAGSQDADNRLLFLWQVTGGRLRGEGQKVTWDLSGLADGTYTATVEVNDGNQLTASASTTVTTARCSDCMTVVIPCPVVAVACPSRADSKQSLVYEATVSGGYTELKTTYTWSVTAGKIISGQGTTKITVDASNLAGQSITATVTVGGYDPRCTGNTASCSVIDVLPTALIRQTH
jgi:hypothetical protein